MKINIKNIIGVFAFVAVVLSCDTNNEITGYSPATYEAARSFSLEIDATTATDNSFEVMYTPTFAGTGYYVVSPAGSGAPTSTQVHSGSGSGVIQSGNFDVDNSTPITFTVDSNLFGDYEYTVYAIHKSTDNFISEVVTAESFTTPDTADPVFNGDASVPTNGFGYYDPTNTNMFLNFSEPVFYNDGDITLTGTRSGEVVIFNGANTTFSQVDDVFIGFNPGLLVEDELYVLSFGADTFRDKSGKPVAEVAFAAYLWATDHYTTEFELSQIFGGATSRDFDYAILDNVDFAGIGLPIPLSGTYTITLDGDTSELFNALDQTYGDDSYAFKVRYEAVTGVHGLGGGESYGFIYLEPNPQQSLFTSGGLDLFWNAWYDFADPGLTGFYDTAGGGLIELEADFGGYYGFGNSPYFGDIFYDYIPTPTPSAPKAANIATVEPSVDNMLAIKASASKRISTDVMKSAKSYSEFKAEYIKNRPERIRSVLNSLETK